MLLNNKLIIGVRSFFETNSSLARVIKNLGWLLAGKGFGAVLSLFYLALVTRLLGPAGFGSFTLILVTAQVASAFVSFESWQLVIRFGSQLQARKANDEIHRLAAFCLLLDISSALLGILLVTGLIVIFAQQFGWQDEMIGMAILFAVISLLSVRSSAIGILRLFDRFRDGALAAAMTPLARFAGALLAWTFSPDIRGFLIAWAAAEVITCIAYWVTVRLVTPVRFAGLRLSEILAAPKGFSQFFSFLWITNLGTTVRAIAQQVPLLVVGFFVGPAAAGLFRLAYQLKDAVARLADMLGRAVYAELSAVDSHEGGEARKTLFAQTSRISAIGSILLVIIAVFLGKPALQLIGGDAFLPAYPILLVLSLAAGIELWGVNFEPNLMAAGRPKAILWIRTAAVSVLLALMAILIPGQGGLGAAYAILAYSLLANMALWIFTRYSDG